MTEFNNLRKGRLRNNHLIVFLCYSLIVLAYNSQTRGNVCRWFITIFYTVLKAFIFVSQPWLVLHQFDCHVSILSACLASKWIALNTCFESLSYLICSSSMNISLNNGCHSSWCLVYNTVIIKMISLLLFQIFMPLVMKTDTDLPTFIIWAGIKRLQWQDEPRWPYQNMVIQMSREKWSLALVTHVFSQWLGNKIIVPNKGNGKTPKGSSLI